MTGCINDAVSLILKVTQQDNQTVWKIIKECIILVGGFWVMKKIAGKLPKSDIHAGRIVGMDSAKSSAPANLVLPKATKAPKAPQAPASVLLRVELANKKG
jgi:hypothetical protein